METFSIAFSHVLKNSLGVRSFVTPRCKVLLLTLLFLLLLQEQWSRQW